MNKAELLEKAVRHFSRDTTPVGDIDLDEAVHDAKSGEAANINNEGVRAQLTYLLEYHGPEWLEGVLQEEGVKT